jgi:hypothetical protein
MKNQIYLYKDDNKAIVLSKDHYHGVVVQVVRFIDQLQPGPNGELYNVKTNSVVFQVLVPITELFRNQTAEAIKKCEVYLQDMTAKDNEIDGLLNDYYSAHKDLNEPGQQ